MAFRQAATAGSRKSSYTRGVTIRRPPSRMTGVAALAALLVVSTETSAQGKGGAPGPDLAREAGQAAHALGDAADSYADGEIEAAKRPPENPLERARQGVVLLERKGKALGLGSVLHGDGRILTALSPLGHGNDVDARFADGSVMRVRVGHSDRAWDLALLVPQNGRWTKGLRASRRSARAAGTSLSSFSLVSKKQLAPSRTIVKGRRTLIGGDSELLRDGLELASRMRSTDIGSPVVDGNGDVVAVVARACAPVAKAPCSMVPFGVPVSAVKAFLRTVPGSAVPPAPWLGIQGAKADTGAVRGVRVLSVHPRSPAAAAGLRGNSDPAKADLVVAVDGSPVTTPEELADTINRRAVGDTVQVLLFGEGRFRQVTLELRAAPGAKTRQAAGTKRGRARNIRSRSRGPKATKLRRSRARVPIGY
jgi:serine protease Do